MSQLNHRNEMSIIGCIFSSREAVYECLDKLLPSDFRSENLRQLYELLIRAATELEDWKFEDIITYIGSKSGNEKLWRLATECYSMIPSAANLPVFVSQQINESSLLNLAKDIAKGLSQIQSNGGRVEFGEVADPIIKKALALKDRTAIRGETLQQINERALENIFSRTEKGFAGYSWGLKGLDKLTGGIELKKTYVAGGLKKSGKTKFAVNTSHALWKQGIPFGWISMEMSSEALLEWFYSRFALIDNDELKTGKLTQQSKADLMQIAEALSDEKILDIDDRAGLDAGQIHSTIRRMSIDGKKVIFLDYIQRANIDVNNKNDAKALQDLCYHLADWAKEFNVAIIYLSQVVNSAENRIVRIGDMKGSGGIGEAVDCAIAINNLDRLYGKNFKERKYTRRAKFCVEQKNGAADDLEFDHRLQYSLYDDIMPGLSFEGKRDQDNRIEVEVSGNFTQDELRRFEEEFEQNGF